MPEAVVGQVAGAAVGGLLGGKKSSGSTQTASKEPWEPTQAWLKDIISQGQGLQGYYQQNPFNSIQQQGYANTVNDADTYRNQLLPSLMGLANNLTSGANNYDRRDPFKKPVGVQMSASSDPGVRQSASDKQFLEGLYQSNFNRGSDADGLNYWLNTLKSGAPRDAVRGEFDRIRAQQTGTPQNPGYAQQQPMGLLGGTPAQTAQQFSLLNPYTSGKLQAAQPSMPKVEDQINEYLQRRFPQGTQYNDFGGGGG